MAREPRLRGHDERLEHAAKFAIECLHPGVRLNWLLYEESSRCGRLDAEIGQALATLFDEAEITAAERIGRLVVVSVSLKDPSMESKIKLEAEPGVSRAALLGNVDIAALR